MSFSTRLGFTCAPPPTGGGAAILALVDVGFGVGSVGAVDLGNSVFTLFGGVGSVVVIGFAGSIVCAFGAGGRVGRRSNGCGRGEMVAGAATVTGAFG